MRVLKIRSAACLALLLALVVALALPAAAPARADEPAEPTGKRVPGYVVYGRPAELTPNYYGRALLLREARPRWDTWAPELVLIPGLRSHRPALRPGPRRGARP